MNFQIIYFFVGIVSALLIVLFFRMYNTPIPIKEYEEPLLYRDGKSEYYYDKNPFVNRVQKVASKFQSAVTNSHNTYNNSFNVVNNNITFNVYYIPLEHKKQAFICSNGQDSAEYIDYENKKSIEFKEEEKTDKLLFNRENKQYEY